MNPNQLDQLALAVAKGPAHPSPLRAYTCVLLSFAGALLLMILGLGIRPDVSSASASDVFWIKLAFPLTLSVLTLQAVKRVVHPGANAMGSVKLIVIAVVAFWIVALVPTYGSTPSTTFQQDLWGRTWRECPLYIGLISLPMLGVAMWLLRYWGPVSVRLAGGLAGFVCGTLAAAIYALHCQESGFLFLGTWYLIGALVPMVIGTVLGPSVLKW